VDARYWTKTKSSARCTFTRISRSSDIQVGYCRAPFSAPQCDFAAWTLTLKQPLSLRDWQEKVSKYLPNKIIGDVSIRKCDAEIFSLNTMKAKQTNFRLNNNFFFFFIWSSRLTKLFFFLTHRVKDKKKDKEDDDQEKKKKKRNRFLSLRLFKSRKDKDKEDEESLSPPGKSTEPSPRKVGPAASDFNLEALKRVGDLLNSQPSGGDSTCTRTF